jgi:hypothetical protein
MTARDDAAAAKQMNEALGTIPYHFRWLADIGLVEEIGSRQRRGATERIYGSTARIPAGARSWPMRSSESLA